MRNLQREIGHVERSGDAVQQCGAHQEQGRSNQIDGDVVQSRLHARASRAMQEKSIGGGQEHLIEHEQIEDIAREKGPVEAHELNLQQRVKVHTRAMPARKREQHAAKADDTAQHQHQGRQTIDRQHDTEGHVPVRRQIDAHRAGCAIRAHRVKQRDRHQETECARTRTDECFCAAPLAQEQQQDCGEKGQHDGCDHEVRQPVGHASPLSPST